VALQFLFNSTTDLPENQRRQNKSLYKALQYKAHEPALCHNFCHWFWFCWNSLILAHLACKWLSKELLKNLWRRRSTGSIVPSLMLWNSAKNPLQRQILFACAVVVGGWVDCELRLVPQPWQLWRSRSQPLLRPCWRPAPPWFPSAATIAATMPPPEDAFKLGASAVPPPSPGEHPLSEESIFERKGSFLGWSSEYCSWFVLVVVHFSAYNDRFLKGFKCSANVGESFVDLEFYGAKVLNLMSRAQKLFVLRGLKWVNFFDLTESARVFSLWSWIFSWMS
jgi:hypothetical protein